MQTWLGRYTGRSLHLIGTILGGFWIATNILNFFWPEKDQISTNSLLDNQIEKIKFPNNSVNIILVRFNDSSNPYKVQEDITNLDIIQIDESGDSTITPIPILYNVNINKKIEEINLNYAYKIGGVSLINQLISKELNVPSNIAKGYIAGPNTTISNFISIIQRDYSEKNNFSQADSIKIKNKREVTNQDKTRLGLINANNFYDYPERINIKVLTKEIISLTETNLSYKELLSINALILKQYIE